MVFFTECLHFTKCLQKKYFQEQFALMPLIEGKMIKDILYTQNIICKIAKKKKKEVL